MLQGTTGKEHDVYCSCCSAFLKFSQKRNDQWSKKIKELLPSIRHIHLIDICKTRWVARKDGPDIFCRSVPGSCGYFGGN